MGYSPWGRKELDTIEATNNKFTTWVLRSCHRSDIGTSKSRGQDMRADGRLED